MQRIIKFLLCNSGGRKKPNQKQKNKLASEILNINGVCLPSVIFLLEMKQRCFGAVCPKEI